MQRRTFLQTTLATGGIAAMPAMTFAADDAAAKGTREFFELRSYFLRPDKKTVLDNYFQTALIPALNRLGVTPVGAFYETPAPPTPVAYLLMPYQSLDQMAKVAAGLVDDAEYQKSAADYLAIPATDPVYDRVESSLLMAFETMPKLEAPEKKSQLFNLRVYESHSEAAGKKKIEMFNKGEIAIFRRVGLTPVLFGETIVGARMPNLTYLLTFDDDAARDEAWNRFRIDPDWIKLKSVPEYEDKRIVSKITNKLLTPTEYSQI
jgi:NIPSNAP